MCRNLKYYRVKECVNTQVTSSFDFSYSTSIIECFLEGKKEKLEALGFKAKSKIKTGFLKRIVNKVAVKKDYSVVVVGEVQRYQLG